MSREKPETQQEWEAHILGKPETPQEWEDYWKLLEYTFELDREQLRECRRQRRQFNLAIGGIVGGFCLFVILIVLKGSGYF